MNHYLKDKEEVIKDLNSNINGLLEEDAKHRLEKNGYNEIVSEKERSLIFIFFRQFHSILIYILLIAAFIAFLFNHLVDVYVILAVIILNAFMGFFQEYKAERAIQSLKNMIVPSARVFRSGELLQIKAKELVIGDIIFIEEGDKIPADARIIESKNFRTEEASLTGESFPTSKNNEKLLLEKGISDRKNMVFMGTFAVSGQAKAVVTSIGINTTIGEIANKMTEIKKEKSHFEKKANKLGNQMGVIAIGVSLFIFLVGFFIRGFEFEEIFLFTIASIVSGIPEGLPAILVIVLAIGVSRMAKRNAIIRRLSSTETLGVVNVIATDKTGTLTQNTMNIEQIVMTEEEDVFVSGDGWKPKGNFTQSGKIISPLENSSLSKLIHIACLCNNARLVKEEKTYNIIGDPTEASLVVLAEKAGLNKDMIKSKENKIDDISFDSELKYRASLVSKEGENKKEIYVVGAPEVLINLSTHCLKNGKIEKFGEKEKKEIEEKTTILTKKAMRVIALAYKPFTGKSNNVPADNIDNLVFVGVVGMIDPPRKGVREAILKTKNAGIRVIMMTGDHKETALSIAKEIGLVKKDENTVYTEQDLSQMSDLEFKKAVKNVNVFARLIPSTKLKIAEELQRQGNIIAMTGDGVNDALAIKRADIGIAMGIVGTDTARESAEIILADDNFASIVNAIEEGRVVFANTKQSSSFLITTNFAEHASIIGTMVMGLPLPLLPTQILWLNLVTDGFPSIALAAEPGHGDTLKEKPRKKDEGILSKDIIPFLVLMVGMMFFLVIITFKIFLIESVDKARTGAFLIMAFTQLFNSLNMRSFKRSLFEIGIFTNIYLVIGIFISVALQIIAIYTPFFQKIFSFYPLSMIEITVIIIMSSFVLWFGELYKLVIRIWTKKKSLG